jgi:hypothetical protein
MKTMKISVTLLLLSLFQITFGQVTEKESQLKTQNADTTEGWKKGGIMALNLSQTSLTNWSAGGQNSFAVNGLFSAFASYKKNKNAWDNMLDIGYGLMRQGGKDAKYIKTDDKIDLLSKYGKQAFSDFYYAALLNFKTQMTAGYNYPNDSVKISDIFAPAYLLAAIGLDYKPNNYFSAFLAPITGKFTFVADAALADAGAFGVGAATYDGNVILQHGKKIKSEFGGYLRVIYSKNDFTNDFLKNVAFTTKMDLFSNYFKNPQKIDVSWETQIALKVNKYIIVNFNTHLLYDYDIKIAKYNNDGTIKDIKPRVQFKEILGVGFSCKF